MSYRPYRTITEARLEAIVDLDAIAAGRLAKLHNAAVETQESVLVDPSIDAIVIANSTNTHAGLVEAATRAGKAVFYEKCWTSTAAGPRRASRSSAHAACR